MTKARHAKVQPADPPPQPYPARDLAAPQPRGDDPPGHPPPALAITEPQIEDYEGAFLEFALVAGAGPAARVVHEWGGKSIDIPQHAAGSRLAEIAGRSAAARLCAEFGGERVAVPPLYVAAKPERNRQILDARAEGLSMRQIAARFDLTVRAVYYILNPKADEEGDE